jgi:hypothetical protein
LGSLSNFLGPKKIRVLPGGNLVGRINALVNGKRLDVAITRTTFGFFAAVEYDGLVLSRWSRTPSGAVKALGMDLKSKVG